MDPAKRSSVGARSDRRLEEQVQDWLRYGEDLGLGPFYRDRPPLHAKVATTSAAAEAHNVAASGVISAAAPAAMAAAAPGRAPAAPLRAGRVGAPSCPDANVDRDGDSDGGRRA